MVSSEAAKMRLKVVVRLRPTDNSVGLAHADHRVLYIKDPLRGHSSEFVFDKVFDGEAKQDAVFQEVGLPLVEHVMQGYNACCLAYGHTGSGKSYSMYGRDSMNIVGASSSSDGGELGVIPRACEMISRSVIQINRKADNLEASGASNVVRMKLFVSFMEIYMENVRDLGAAAQAYIKAQAARADPYDGPPAGLGLAAFASADGGAPSRTATTSLRDPCDYVRNNLDVMEDASGMTFVKDLTYVEVTSVEDMLALLQAGYAVRSTCPIDLSSRSHTVFTVSVVTYRGDQQPVTGRLNLVDLAGSEKQSRSGPEGHRLRESSAINKALTALSKVLTALSQGPPAPASMQPHRSPLAHAPSQPAGGTAPGSPTTSLSSALSASSASSPPTSLPSATQPLPTSSIPMATAAPSTHVPFRDAKLTRVLKDSLVGNSFTVLLACVHPVFDEVDESAATLQYATKVLTNSSSPHNVNLLAAGGPVDSAMVEDLSNQVVQLKDELEVTHAHYQKLIESIAGPSWRHNPGPLERAPGADGDFSTAGLGAFAAALSSLGKPGGGGGGGGAGGGGGPGMNRRGSFGNGEDRRRTSAIGGDAGRGGSRAPPSEMGRTVGPAGGGHGVAKSVMGGATVGANAAARISMLEAQIRKLESQLTQARISAQQYEERLTARKEEMEVARERMAGKEHAQFAEIKKLRAQVADLTKALEAERMESAHKLEDARRRSDDEVARLLKDIDTLRNQLAQVTGTVGNLVERHSAAISAEKRQLEAVKIQATQMLQQQYNRGTEEHKAQVENLKQQSAYFLARRAEELAEAKQQLDAARAAHAAEKDALLAELDYLASYSERVTELVRRMEAGVVPVHERGNGVKSFRLPQRDRPPRLDGQRLAILKERSADLHERLTALSAATAMASSSSYNQIGSNSTSSLTASGGPGPGPAASTPSATAGAGTTFGGWMSSTSPSRGASGVLGPAGAGAGGALGSSVDLDALRAQVEAELKAQVTAQVVGDLKSDKTVEYIRELEAAVGRYRTELQTEKKRSSEMAVALRSVQRQHQRPESPINKALATHTPSGTIKLTPTWGLGHTTPLGGSASASLSGAAQWGGISSSGGVPMSRPATAGLGSLVEQRAAGFVSAPNSARRPTTSMAHLTSSFRENGVAIP